MNWQTPIKITYVRPSTHLVSVRHQPVALSKVLDCDLSLHDAALDSIADTQAATRVYLPEAQIHKSQVIPRIICNAILHKHKEDGSEVKPPCPEGLFTVTSQFPGYIGWQPA